MRRPILRDPASGHACLLYPESIGCRHAPRFHGIDDAGREVLSFIPGVVPSDLGHIRTIDVDTARPGERLWNLLRLMLALAVRWLEAWVVKRKASATGTGQPLSRSSSPIGKAGHAVLLTQRHSRYL